MPMLRPMRKKSSAPSPSVEARAPSATCPRAGAARTNGNSTRIEKRSLGNDTGMCLSQGMTALQCPEAWVNSWRNGRPPEWSKAGASILHGRLGQGERNQNRGYSEKNDAQHQLEDT